MQSPSLSPKLTKCGMVIMKVKVFACYHVFWSQQVCLGDRDFKNGFCFMQMLCNDLLSSAFPPFPLSMLFFLTRNWPSFWLDVHLRQMSTASAHYAKFVWKQCILPGQKVISTICRWRQANLLPTSGRESARFRAQYFATASLLYVILIFIWFVRSYMRV